MHDVFEIKIKENKRIIDKIKFTNSEELEDGFNNLKKKLGWFK